MQTEDDKVCTYRTLDRPVREGQFGNGDLQGGRGIGDGLDGVDHDVLGLGKGTDDAHGNGGDDGEGVTEELHGARRDEGGKEERVLKDELRLVRAMSNEEL